MQSERFAAHNLFRVSLQEFISRDPQLSTLAKLRYQHSADWWKALSLNQPGIYILTGGRQVGKSTSCKLFIQHCLQDQQAQSNNIKADEIFYLPCDEIFDAKELSQTIRSFLDTTNNKFLLIIDEISFVANWERVIKSLADEGWFTRGHCILTGSDTLIQKDAAMSFPGRRGNANQTDFHLYPLSFAEYVKLLSEDDSGSDICLEKLENLFHEYLQCGGYLRAINDFATNGEVTAATYQTYEQWIRGDILKQGKNEAYLLAILNGLMTVGVSQISYTKLAQKIGLVSKETCIDYLRLLQRMDVIFELQAYDQNKRQGFPRKDRKFHFMDPFIARTIHRWLQQEGLHSNGQQQHILEPSLVEACVASYCHRYGKAFYFKGQGEVDVIWLPTAEHKDGLDAHHEPASPLAIEVKWANQIRPNDLKTLKQFNNSIILRKRPQIGKLDGIDSMPVYQFLFVE